VGNGSTPSRVGVYPGSFDPPTIAHVHVAERAISRLGLARVDFTISTTTLGKDDSRLSPIEDRVAELVAISEGHPALAVRTTADGLLVDIAEGYDVVILGADKWAQVLDPAWYGGVSERDTALRRLPLVALAPRPPFPLPGDDPSAEPPVGVEVVVIDTDPDHHPVSATGVREGRAEWRARPADPR
jgi:hypothetical protein